MLCRFIPMIMIAVTNSAIADQISIHVSPNGQESASGTISDPFATIEQARNRIRQLRSEEDTETALIEVLVHAGKYPQPNTLEFTAQDSGTHKSPIVYRAVDGEVLITGGVEINDWQKITRSDLMNRLPAIARSQVVFTDLKSLGIDPGTLSSRRLHQQMHSAPIELFACKQRQPRAGWPNQGWATAKPTGSINWKLETANIIGNQTDVWAQGFWEQDWNSSFEPVAIDSSLKTLTLTSADPLRPKQVREGARYRLSNLLSELDSPGEWYVDDASGLLLYWPLEDNSSTSVSVLDTILSIYDVEHVSFDGFRIESARSMNVEIVGGNDVCLKNCTVSQAGTVAVHVLGGLRHSIVDCEISCTGSSAVRIEGGNRSTLDPCNHYVENCHIHQFAQHYLAGRPAVAIYGVGVILSTNHIHHGPDGAIAIHGNEHIVEHNEIAHVCSETDDAAAIHLSYDPTYRGNVIRKNYIHDLGGFSKTGIIGIYLDDFASGTVVESNLLQNTIRGIAIGGGRDNRIENNVIQNSIAPIQVDARGLTWARDQIEGESSRLSKLCKSVLEESPIFGIRYPELKDLLENEPAIPKGNVVRSNSFNGLRGIDLQGFDRTVVVLENNRRTSGSEIASFEIVVKELGIELHTNNSDDSRETRVSRPKYVLQHAYEAE